MKRTPLQNLGDQPFDVVVIGGGIIGSAVIRDAALRGYRSILFERDDFGAGSSCRASRLWIGSPAFLERGELKTLRSLERERLIQTHIAPHLVRPVDSLYAVSHSKSKPAGPKRRIVGYLQALSNPEGSVNRIKTLSGKKLQSTSGYLSAIYQKRGYQVTDCVVHSPERLCLENLLSAELNGARVVNYAKVVSVQVHNRQIQGVIIEDRMTGRTLRLQGRCIVNATGPWVDEVCRLADDRYISRLRRQRESYVVVPQLATPLASALVFEARSDGRPIEVVPWNDQLILGACVDEDVQGLDAPQTTDKDADYLLSEVHSVVPALPVDRQRIRFSFSAIRTLSAETRRHQFLSASRPVLIDHGHMGGPRGLISVVGGMLAHHRSIAEQTVDALQSYVGGSKVRECTSHKERLFGGNIQDMETFIDEVSNAARNFSLTEKQVRHLVSIYGTKSQEIFQWLKNTPELREPFCPHLPDIKAQLLYSIDREFAVTIGDIFLRRTGVGTRHCRGLDCAATAADTLAKHLGWSAARVEVETKNYFEEQQRLYGSVPGAMISGSVP